MYLWLYVIESLILDIQQLRHPQWLSPVYQYLLTEWRLSAHHGLCQQKEYLNEDNFSVQIIFSENHNILVVPYFSSVIFAPTVLVVMNSDLIRVSVSFERSNFALLSRASPSINIEN